MTLTTNQGAPETVEQMTTPTTTNQGAPEWSRETRQRMIANRMESTMKGNNASTMNQSIMTVDQAKEYEMETSASVILSPES